MGLQNAVNLAIKNLMEEKKFDNPQQAYLSTYMNVAGQVLVDGAVVMKRVREDSDAVHEKLQQWGGPSVALHRVLKGINEDLVRLNVALAAVPAMATEMNVMNRQMSVMSHSVGSTMARMGSIMPW